MTTLYTIGHSSRSLEELVALLHENGVEGVVDVRRYPGSRRHPHFARDSLAASLPEHGIDYLHEAELGGRRQPRPDSPNTAWRNEGFRGYADYMDSSSFAAALGRVLERARHRTIAVMCAEAHPSRCHRRLLADAALVRGWDVLHVIDAGRVEEHAMNPDARPAPDGTIRYPGDGQLGLFGGSRSSA